MKKYVLSLLVLVSQVYLRAMEPLPKQYALSPGTRSNAIKRQATLLLREAIAENDSEAVKSALDNGADINAKEGNSENTPLLQAIFRNRSAIVKILLERGARIDLTDRFGDSPLKTALKEYSVNKPATKEIVELLIKHSMTQPNRIDLIDELVGENKTPLLYAAIDTGDKQIVHLFMEAGASPFATGLSWQTPLEHAAEIENTPVCTELLRGMLLYPLRSKMLEHAPAGGTNLDVCKKSLTTLLGLASKGRCPKDVRDFQLMFSDCALYLFYNRYMAGKELCPFYKDNLVTRFSQLVLETAQLDTIKEEMERASERANDASIKELFDSTTLESRIDKILF